VHASLAVDIQIPAIEPTSDLGIICDQSFIPRE